MLAQTKLKGHVYVYAWRNELCQHAFQCFHCLNPKKEYKSNLKNPTYLLIPSI